MKLRNFFSTKARTIAREAAEWRTEMDEPSSAAQIAAFEAWLKADPAHLRAYQELDSVAHVGTQLSAADEKAHSYVPVLQGYRPGYAIAAALLLAIGIWSLVREPAPTYAAIINDGQATRVVALRDGSIVALDTATTLHVAADPATRHVRVSSGRARFAVRWRSERFKVTTATSQITVANGVFDVAVMRGDVRVWAISGNARVAVDGSDPHSTPILLRSGQSFSVRNGAAEIRRERSDPTWPLAHVAFENAPLAAVLAKANRAGLPKISAANDSVGDLRITGVLDLRDTRKLARKLAAALDLRAIESGERVLLTR